MVVLETSSSPASSTWVCLPAAASSSKCFRFVLPKMGWRPRSIPAAFAICTPSRLRARIRIERDSLACQFVRDVPRLR